MNHYPGSKSVFMPEPDTILGVPPMEQTCYFWPLPLHMGVLVVALSLLLGGPILPHNLP